MKNFILSIILGTLVFETSTVFAAPMDVPIQTDFKPNLPNSPGFLRSYGLITAVYALGAYWFMQDHPMLVLGVIGKTLSSHLSKKFNQNPSLSIGFDTVGQVCTGLIAKEGFSAAAQPLMERLPNWMKSNRGTPSVDMAECRRIIEQNKHALQTNATSQAYRINKLKEQQLRRELEIMLNKIDGWLKPCPFSYICEDHSLGITNKLIEFSDFLLYLYPGFTNTENSFEALPNISAAQTGESFTYDEKIIEDAAEKYHLGARISAKTERYIANKFGQLIKKNERTKAEYLQHFLDLLGIVLKLPEPAAQSNAGAKTPDL